MKRTPLSRLVWELLFTPTARKDLTGRQRRVVQRIVKQAADWVGAEGGTGSVLAAAAAAGFRWLVFLWQPEEEAVKIVLPLAASSLSYSHAACWERWGGREKGMHE